MNWELETHSIAGLAAMLGLIGLCFAYPTTFTPGAFAGAAFGILAGIAGTTAAKSYQKDVQAKAAALGTSPLAQSAGTQP